MDKIILLSYQIVFIIELIEFESSKWEHLKKFSILYVWVHCWYFSEIQRSKLEQKEKSFNQYLNQLVDDIWYHFINWYFYKINYKLRIKGIFLIFSNPKWFRRNLNFSRRLVWVSDSDIIIINIIKSKLGFTNFSRSKWFINWSCSLSKPHVAFDYYGLAFRKK